MYKIAISKKLISEALRARQLRTLFSTKVGKFRGLEGEALEKFVANRKKLKMSSILTQPFNYLNKDKLNLSRKGSKNLVKGIALAQRRKGLNKPVNEGSKGTDAASQLNLFRMLLNRGDSKLVDGSFNMALLPNIKKYIRQRKVITKDIKINEKILQDTNALPELQEAAMEKIIKAEEDLGKLTNNQVTVSDIIHSDKGAKANLKLGDSGFESDISTMSDMMGNLGKQVEGPVSWDHLNRIGESTAYSLEANHYRGLMKSPEKTAKIMQALLSKGKYKDKSLEQLRGISPQKLWEDFSKSTGTKPKGLGKGIDFDKRIDEAADALGATSGIYTYPGNEVAAGLYYKAGFGNIDSSGALLKTKEVKSPLFRALYRKITGTALPSKVSNARITGELHNGVTSGRRYLPKALKYDHTMTMKGVGETLSEQSSELVAHMPDDLKGKTRLLLQLNKGGINNLTTDGVLKTNKSMDYGDAIFGYEDPNSLFKLPDSDTPFTISALTNTS